MIEKMNVVVVNGWYCEKCAFRCLCALKKNNYLKNCCSVSRHETSSS